MASTCERCHAHVQCSQPGSAPISSAHCLMPEPTLLQHVTRGHGFSDLAEIQVRKVPMASWRFRAPSSPSPASRVYFNNDSSESENLSRSELQVVHDQLDPVHLAQSLHHGLHGRPTVFWTIAACDAFHTGTLPALPRSRLYLALAFF